MVNNSTVNTPSTNGHVSQARAQHVVSSTGLSIWRGSLNEEYLSDLKPFSKAYKVYTQMEDDAVVGALLDAIKAPLLAAGFEVTTGGNSEGDQKAKDFLWYNMNHMDVPWGEHTNEALTHLVYGWSMFEWVLNKHPDGLLHLASLVPIGQDTWQEWGPLDEFGRTTSFKQKRILQYKVGDDVRNDINAQSQLHDPIDIPMAKLVHFTINARKRNPFGKSLLRNIYRSWYIRSNIEVLEAIGVERDVGGIPVFELPESGITDDQLTALKDTAEGLRIDEAGYLIVPFGVKVSPYAGGSKGYNARDIINSYNHIMRQRFFSDFISFGAESTGGQALSREAQTFFFKALIYIQNSMMEVWNSQLVPILFQWNDGQFNLSKDQFGNPIYPRIRWKNPGRLDVQNLATYAGTLIDKKLLTPTRELEEHYRYIADLPELPPDVESVTEKVDIDALAGQGVTTGEVDPDAGGRGPTSGERQSSGGARGQTERANQEGSRAT